jgi:hypothetical protein
MVSCLEDRLFNPSGDKFVESEVIGCNTDPTRTEDKENEQYLEQEVAFELCDFDCGLDGKDEADNVNDSEKHNLKSFDYLSEI